MTAIREALRLTDRDTPVWKNARAELDALGAVAEAARDVRAALVAEKADVMMENGPVFIEILDEALARLAAVRDGQTPRGGASGNDGTDAGSQPANGCAERQSRPDVPRGACPCRVHGDPDGDCGERCA